MKLITANKLNRFWKNGVLAQVNKLVAKTKVLTTVEQVAANTNAENIANALVTKQIYNNLTSHPQFIYDASGKITGYKTRAGADTVFPFNSKFTSYKGTNTNSITADADYNAVFFITVHNATSCDIKDCKKNNASISNECLKIRVGNSLDLWIYQDQIKSGDTISFTETANYQYIVLLA